MQPVRACVMFRGSHFGATTRAEVRGSHFGATTRAEVGVCFTPTRWGNRPARLWIAGFWGVAPQTDGGNEVRVCGGLEHQKEKRNMDHFAGLDVSVKETSICIVDDTGKIVREVKVASEPEALLQVLTNPVYYFKRIGLEAGPLSQWLFSALAEMGLPVICVETRHMRAVLKAQINKTDRNDARGIAQMMRAGLYRPVHVKTLRSQKLRMLLTHRKLLQSKAIAIENDLRATLRNFGLKVGVVGATKFEVRIKELVENLPDLVVLVEPLLIVRRVLHEQIDILHRRLLAVVRNDDVCRRLMTIPGVGPVVALTYRVTVDVPARFKNSKAVGAAFGLTPARYQSGESDRTGGISRCGDEMMRAMLYEAAQIMLIRTTKWSWLKAWAMKIAKNRGMKTAIVALARRLAVIMHRIWIDGTEFRWTKEVAAA
jgi:transposase